MCRLAGQYVAETRNKQKISCRELYKRTKISISVQSDLETGKRMPRIETLIKLMIALNIPLDSFFGSELISSNFDKKSESDKLPEEKSLRIQLSKMGYSNIEVKEILLFLKYIRIKKFLKCNYNDSLKYELIMNDGKLSEEYKRFMDICLKLI